MTPGFVLPDPGYLERGHKLTARHDVVLIFDEVKTGLAIAAGGATERFGVRPDMVTLAKTLGGGLPAGAVGGTEELMASSRTAPSTRWAPTTATPWAWRRLAPASRRC